MNSYIPIGGAKVRARRWFTTKIGYTNSDGFFQCAGNGFKRAANYSIVWESDKWDIRNGLVVQAYYNGPKQHGDWNLNIRDGKSLRYATITRALYEHFYGINGFMIKTQSPNRNIKIRYRHKTGAQNGSFYTGVVRGVWPDITIFGKNIYGWRDTNEILSTTFHELTHCAMFHRLNYHNYMRQHETIRESWAVLGAYVGMTWEYIQRGFDIHEYETIQGKLWEKPNDYNKQGWNLLNHSHIYTPIFIDLYDNVNQRQYFKTCNTPYLDYECFVNDNIFCNNMVFLQDIIYGYKPQTVSDLEEILRSNYIGNFGITEQSLNDFFEFYRTL